VTMSMKCSPLCSNPQQIISVSWFASIFIAFVLLICACFAVRRITSEGFSASNCAAGYAIIWTAALAIIVSIIGTVIMRKFKSKLSVGFFLGTILVMFIQMLMLFAICLNYTYFHPKKKVTMVVSVLAFFLAVNYGVFGMTLNAFRKDVIQDISFNISTDRLSRLSAVERNTRSSSNVNVC
jgi:hypothetical protein